MRFSENDPIEALLGQVIKLFHARVRTMLGGLGLYRGQPAILFLLWERDGRTQKELAEVLGLSPATITIMLRRMAREGLLERRDDPADQRVSRVYLTKRGKKIRAAVVERNRMLSDQCLAGFSDKERDQMKSFLARLRANLIEAAQGAGRPSHHRQARPRMEE